MATGVFTFDAASGTLVGAYYATDYPRYCGYPSIEAGIILREGTCGQEWCLLSGEGEEPPCPGIGGQGGSEAAP